MSHIEKVTLWKEDRRGWPDLDSIRVKENVTGSLSSACYPLSFTLTTNNSRMLIVVALAAVRSGQLLSIEHGGSFRGPSERIRTVIGLK